MPKDSKLSHGGEKNKRGMTTNLSTLGLGSGDLLSRVIVERLENITINLITVRHYPDGRTEVR